MHFVLARLWHDRRAWQAFNVARLRGDRGCQSGFVSGRRGHVSIRLVWSVLDRVVPGTNVDRLIREAGAITIETRTARNQGAILSLHRTTGRLNGGRRSDG